MLKYIARGNGVFSHTLVFFFCVEVGSSKAVVHGCLSFALHSQDISLSMVHLRCFEVPVVTVVCIIDTCPSIRKGTEATSFFHIVHHTSVTINFAVALDLHPRFDLVDV